jgi:integrase
MAHKKTASERKIAPNGQPMPREQADGTWRVDVSLGYHPVTGRPRRKTIRGESSAEVLTKMRKLQVEADEGIIKDASTLTVKEWCEIWLKTYTGHLAPRTRTLYEGDINNYIAPRLGRHKLRALNRPMVQQFINGITESPLKDSISPKTVKNIHGTLSRLLNQSVEIDYLRVNPATRCKLPRVEKTRPRSLDRQEITAFLEAISGHRFETAFLLALHSGLREAEILGLKWDAVNIEGGTIEIKRQLQLIKGEYKLTPPKGNKLRTVHIGELALDALRRQKRTQAEWRLRAGSAWRNEGLVFTDELGGHLRRQTFYKQYKDIAASIGSPDASVHTLRHSYATSSMQAGVDARSIQENMGHYSAAFTLDQYASAMNDVQRANTAKLDAHFKGIISSK